MAESVLVYLRLAAAAVRADSGRPLWLVLRTVAAAMIVAVEVLAVVLLLDRFGTIGGWRVPEVVLLFGLAFASQGLALEDMAAARIVYDRAREQNIGREIEF